MKVLMVNGSGNENGCTFTALSVVAEALKAEDIETEIVQLGKSAYMDCISFHVRDARKTAETDAFLMMISLTALSKKRNNRMVLCSALRFITRIPAVVCCLFWTGLFMRDPPLSALNRGQQSYRPDARERQRLWMPLTNISELIRCR